MWQHVKPWIVLIGASALYYSGLLRLYKRMVYRPFALVLNYHRIGVPTTRDQRLLPAMFVSPRSFERHLRYLAANYNVVTMRQLMDMKGGATRSVRPFCAITFDDGWRDNYDVALPLLRKYGLPATIFISTDFIGTQRAPWFYDLVRFLVKLSDLLECGKETCASLSAQPLPKQILKWGALPTADRLSGIERTLETLKRLPMSEVTSAASTLFGLIQRHSEGEDSQRAMLSWDDVREMQKCGIEIGSHGMTHSILTQIHDTLLEKEIAGSKAVLERELQETIVGFSYPNGDYTEHIAALLHKSGYTYACTIKPGSVDLDMPPFQIKRLLLHDENTYNTALFACHMAGLFNRGRE